MSRIKEILLLSIYSSGYSPGQAGLRKKKKKKVKGNQVEERKK